MGSYRVEAWPSAARELASLDSVGNRISDAISRLAVVPRPVGCQKLRGPDSLYRIRLGRFRVVYAISDTSRTLTIVAIGDRKDVYR